MQKVCDENNSKGLLKKFYVITTKKLDGEVVIKNEM